MPSAIAQPFGGPVANAKLRVLSLGAGVQSTTLALMAAHGEIGPMPDCAIFADTGWEPRGVYEHLDRLEKLLPYPVYRVRRGNLREDCLRNARGEIKSGKCSTLPAFSRGKDGRPAPISRQCTGDYKIDPILRKERELLGILPKQRVAVGVLIEQWMGISTDEHLRAKPSQKHWIVTRWPLLESGMSRRDCLAWLGANDYPEPAKSACIGCPYHSDAMWREMRDHDSASWADAIEFDAAIRAGFKGSRGQLFLHRSLVPLSEVDLSTAAERGQPDLFASFALTNFCEDGMCGV